MYVLKGMTAAEAAVKPGGVIIMLAASGDGTGGDSFYHMIADDEIHNTIKKYSHAADSKRSPISGRHRYSYAYL